MKDLVEKFFPDVYALLKPVADSIPEQYRCGLWAAVAINLGASGSHFDPNDARKVSAAFSSSLTSRALMAAI